jgi:hypothetical protein
MMNVPLGGLAFWKELSPQQTMVPSILRAQENPPPEDTWVAGIEVVVINPGPSGSTGLNSSSRSPQAFEPSDMRSIAANLSTKLREAGRMETPGVGFDGTDSVDARLTFFVTSYHTDRRIPIAHTHNVKAKRPTRTGGARC